MKTLLPALVLAALLSLSGGACAYDSDGPIVVPRSASLIPRSEKPQFYQPTQRYWGRDYVVYYHFVPVEAHSRFTPVFGSRELQITSEQFTGAGPAGPRLIVYTKPRYNRTTTTTTTTTTGYEK